MKPLFLVLALFSLFQLPTWQPSPGHTQIPIWPSTPPHPQRVDGPEKQSQDDSLVAGKPWTYIERVTVPTITIYSPQQTNTGAAIMVFPGGGYFGLAIDLEGTEVCDWLVSKGITCVLLKYRVPGNGKNLPQSGPYPNSPVALEDAQRALGLVRLHAAEWHISPRKIGVLGFSAGGHLVAATSNHFKRIYPAIDAADRESCRPDFAVALYPGHLWLDETKFELNPDIHPTRDTPPTFILQAEDDPVDSINNSLVYFVALKKAGVPTELHIFAHGGHAFGLRPTTQPITHWPSLVESWLRTIAIISN